MTSVVKENTIFHINPNSAHINNNTPNESLASVQDVTLCPSCDLAVKKNKLTPNRRAICPRCHTFLYDTPYCSINGMLAICLAAIAMYIPANYLPIIEINFLGNIRSATLIEGAIAIIEQGYYLVGIAVIIASTIAPGLLILSILLQIILVRLGLNRQYQRKIYIFLLSVQTLLTQLTMLEIYLLSLLVSAFQLSDFADVHFGFGTFSFTMLYLCNLFLMREYNLRKMWEHLDD